MAASIKAGFYTIGLAGGVETMSSNPMAWNGGVNPKLDQNQQAADCLLPMGATVSSDSADRNLSDNNTKTFQNPNFVLIAARAGEQA